MIWHAKSYSTIFQTLSTPQEIAEIFEWADHNELLQEKAKMINEVYQNGNELEIKVASVFLESALFYSGFYTPLLFLGNGKMVNSAEIIKLILKDESIHGSYIGTKYRDLFNQLNEQEQAEQHEWVLDFLLELYQLEVKYTEELYGEIGWVEDVLQFVRYNFNKALQNLGFDSVFPDGVIENVNPLVANGISTETSNHDFFSQVGNGYLIGESESMSDDDYDF